MVEIIRRAEKLLDVLLSWNARHDTKFGFLFTIEFALLTSLFAFYPDNYIWSTLSVSFVTLFILFFLHVLFEIISGQFPHINSPNQSIIYFDTIQKMHLDTFVEKFTNIDDDKYLNDILAQCHINSMIVSRKFRNYKRALISLAVSIIPWLLLLFLFERTEVAREI